MISRVTRRLASALDYTASRRDPLRNLHLATTLSEQFAYGHREVLLEAADLSNRNILWGSVPHAGWGRVPKGSLAPRVKRDPYGRELHQWFWNREWQEAAIQNGARRVHAIGAPWLYLLRQMQIRPIWEQTHDSVRSRRGEYLLFVPIHSWEGMQAQINPDIERLKSLSAGIRIKVLLSWGDFLNRNLREDLSRAEIDVDCVGYRSSPLFWPWSSLGDRIMFLKNLVDVLQDAALVVSHVPCTALIYAASLGVPVRVERNLGSISTLTTVESQQMSELFNDYAWMQDHETDVFHHRWEVARDLGFDSLKSPNELRHVLKWRAFID